MYHGQKIAGFPRHPHRGFETITVVQEGLIDHADSLGAAARYGDGDVQWLTAGDGINHAEMFPLLRKDAPNPIDFFQIWINLPSTLKRVPPHFSMLWAEEIPVFKQTDDSGKTSTIRLIAGELEKQRAPSPPPNSWASQEGSEVFILTVEMEPGAAIHIPAHGAGLNRSLYSVSGNGGTVNGEQIANRRLSELRSDTAVELRNGDQTGRYLLLQGKPIAEPVAQRGPFVMNSWDEIRQAYADYQRTQFGGWPWKSVEPVHGMESRRFAQRGQELEVPPKG